MQELPGLRIGGGRIIEERARVLVAHDPRQLGRGVVKLEIADEIGLAGREDQNLEALDYALANSA